MGCAWMKEFCVRASVEEGCVKDMACGRDVRARSHAVKEMFVEEEFVKGPYVEGTYVEELGVKENTLKVLSVICSQARCAKTTEGGSRQHAVLAPAMWPGRLRRPSWKQTICNRCLAAKRQEIQRHEWTAKNNCGYESGYECDALSLL